MSAAGGALPQPRYARTTPRPHAYVRRGSCCLIYQAPDHGRCANCPRQTPGERNARVLATHA